MDENEIIAGKRILIVDDEPDVLETLSALLDICKLDTALTYKEAKELLYENEYDVAILDIMGVKGFELLGIAKDRGVPALMLTAHGLSEENLKRSAQDGASYYAPKEEMTKIGLFVADVLEARAKKTSPWIRWMERLGAYYDRRFGGKDWREKEKEFWAKRTKPMD
jgi:DNA-binding NtrC family response regulator